ncbi:MAG: flagellar hook-basal body complex protein FliE [Holophaga sp.]|jgi:flagellar hook-basal body complex protein FliE
MDPLTPSTQLPALTPLSGTGTQAVSGEQGGAGGPSFGDLLKQALAEVDAAQSGSEQEVRNLMSGDATDMHSAILAVQKADVSFQMMMAVRSKLVDAYRAVMQMQM